MSEGSDDAMCVFVHDQDTLHLSAIGQVSIRVPGDGKLARFKRMTCSLGKAFSPSLQWPLRLFSRFSCVAVSPGQYLDLLRSRKSTARTGYEAATVYSQPDADMQP